MKKVLWCCSLLCLGLLSQAQVVINIQIQGMGLSIKSQLWNLALINTSSASIPVQVQMVLTDESNNQAVLTGTTPTITLNKGMNPITPNDVKPVTYNVQNPNYNLDASQDGFLPVGNFSVCFTVTQVGQDFSTPVGEQCEDIQIEPLSPPMLTEPLDSERLEFSRPLFTWLPPSPFILFNSLSYHLTLVEVSPTQSAGDAIEQNLPLLSQDNIMAGNLQYPASLPELDTGKVYAWQVSAASNGAQISQSEIWMFTIHNGQLDTSTVALPSAYSALQQSLDGSYAISKGFLRFSYNNTVNDTTLPFQIFDITNAQQKTLVLDSTEADVHYGQNLKVFDFTDDGAFVDNHMYVLELTNSNSERWFLKFLYRKPD